MHPQPPFGAEFVQLCQVRYMVCFVLVLLEVQYLDKRVAPPSIEEIMERRLQGRLANRAIMMAELKRQHQNKRDRGTGRIIGFCKTRSETL